MGAWPEPFDADHSLLVGVDDVEGITLSTREGETRADAARRFAADLGPAGGAGCARGDSACVAEAVLAADGWSSTAPIREWREDGYEDACYPAFGTAGCNVAWDPEATGQDWTHHGEDREHGGRLRGYWTDARAVRGAVDDFFSGTAYSAPDLMECPRQVVVTYRERGWNTWMVAK